MDGYTILAGFLLFFLFFIYITWFGFTVKVENSMETLDDHVRFLKGTIQWDTTTIATEGNLQHNGLDGYLIVVDQIFENTDGETIPLKIRAFLIKSPLIVKLDFSFSKASITAL